LASHGRNGSASRRSVSFAAATTLLSLWSEVLRMTLKTPGRICSATPCAQRPSA
jgi:hypothetical protein